MATKKIISKEQPDRFREALVCFLKELDDFDGFGNLMNRVNINVIRTGVVEVGFDQLILSKKWKKASQEIKDGWIGQHRALVDMLKRIADFLCDHRNEMNMDFNAYLMKEGAFTE